MYPRLLVLEHNLSLTMLRFGSESAKTKQKTLNIRLSLTDTQYNIYLRYLTSHQEELQLFIHAHDILHVSFR